MEIVIDIPNDYAEQFYKNKCKDKFDSLATNEFGYVLRKAFEDAKPLPEHHGRLISEEDVVAAIIFSKLFDNAKVGEVKKALLNIPTIIEGSDSE